MRADIRSGYINGWGYKVNRARRGIRRAKRKQELQREVRASADG